MFESRQDGKPHGNEIIRCARKLCLFRYMSFSNFRLNRKLTMHLIPEIRKFSLLFGATSEGIWRAKMDLHSMAINRGLTMGLLPSRNIIPARYVNLDDFMGQICAAELAKGLDFLVSFGSRLILKVQREPDAPLWCIDETVLITRDRLTELSTRVVNLIRVISQLNNNYAASWPDVQCRLRPAALRALDTFLPYAKSAVDPRAVFLSREGMHETIPVSSMNVGDSQSTGASQPVQAITAVNMQTSAVSRSCKRRRLNL